MKDEIFKPSEDRALDRFFQNVLEGFKSGLAKYEKESPEAIQDDVEVHLIVLNAFEQCRVLSRRPAGVPDEVYLQLGELSGNALAALHMYARDQLMLQNDDDMYPAATLDSGRPMS